jgi:hypothetical protein
MKDNARILLSIILGCTLAIAWVLHRHGTPTVTQSGLASKRAGTPPSVDTSTPTTMSPPTLRPSLPPPRARTLVSGNPRNSPASPLPSAQPEAPAAVAAPPAGGDGSGLAEPLARVALSFVGTDFIAEQVWASAINDPTVPPKERQDLIEDLNEDGFPDRHNVTPDDLPLIVNRLTLIEDMAPDAMDDVNAAAFTEAYKDLTKMQARLTRE